MQKVLEQSEQGQKLHNSITLKTSAITQHSDSKIGLIKIQPKIL